jgi:hypothetical protein
MNDQQAEIERIVQAVLAVLERDGGTSIALPKAPALPAPPSLAPAPTTPAASAPTIPPKPAIPDVPPTQADTLVLSSRVVTWADLDGRLGKVRRVVLPPGAVLTPAARDELLRRRVAIVYDASRHKPAHQPRRLLVVVHAGCCESASLVAALAQARLAVETQHLSCLIAATDRLAEVLRDGQTAAVLLTAQPAAAMCLANRHRGVRAIRGNEAAIVAQEADAVGANLLVADPAVAGLYRLKQMIVAFCQDAPRTCPEVWATRLS